MKNTFYNLANCQADKKLNNYCAKSNNYTIFSNVFYSLLYVVLFTYIWREYCVPVWSAYNYEDIPHAMHYELLGYIVAIIPSIFYRGIKNVSSWIALILYYFGYIPIILSLLFNYPQDNHVDVAGYWSVLCFFMCLYFVADRIKYTISPKKKTWSINYIYYFIAITFILQLILYRGNIRIANFYDIYDLREQNSEIGSGFFNYIAAWSGTFTYPFLICYGLFKKNKKHIIIGCLLMFFSFCVYGLKTHLFAPIIIFALFRFLSWQDTHRFNLMSAFTIGISILSVILLFNLENEICYMLAAVFLMRTVTISGCLFSGYYVPFFQNHPHTYFAHINIVNAITGSNPYAGQDIGKVVSEGGMNANAIFWAMDGVTGGGVVGVFIVSLFFFFFLVFINALSIGINKKFVCVLMIMPTMALLNVSFFTFLLSEGVLLIVLCLYKVKLDLPKD